MWVGQGLELFGDILETMAVMPGVAYDERVLTERLPSAAKPRQFGTMGKTFFDIISADGKRLPSF